MPKIFIILIAVTVLSGCRKTEETVFTDNNTPPYDAVPTLLIENYVNRLFIDLIGREPTDDEMSIEVGGLESGGLSMASRSALVDKLMGSTVFLEGDTSYNHAFSKKIYEDHKGRFLDGASEFDMYEQFYLYYGVSVQDSIAGNILAYEINRQQSDRMKLAIRSRIEFRAGAITIDEMCRRMCFNVMYDDINMNTFNFINATFNDLLFRYPTEAELEQSYDPVDVNVPGFLFGQNISSKSEYLDVVIASDEFAQGMIRWAYFSLLSREPNTAELYFALQHYHPDNDIKSIQKSILISDEYAGFE